MNSINELFPYASALFCGFFPRESASTQKVTIEAEQRGTMPLKYAENNLRYHR